MTIGRPLRVLRELAPKCSQRQAREALAKNGTGSPRCAVSCFERLLFCRFKDIFDRFGPPMAPHAAAQYVAAHLGLGKKAVAPLRARPKRGVPLQLRVLFVNRTAHKGCACNQ